MGVKSGRSGAVEPDRFGLSSKRNKCSDAGTGDLGVLTTLLPLVVPLWYRVKTWTSYGSFSNDVLAQNVGP